MSIAEFVSHLRNLDVQLSAEGQRLRLNAPKGVLTDSLRSEIAEHKQELLEFLRDCGQPAAFIPPPILQRTSSDPAPLSFSQERLWFLEQLESGSAVYNICRASRLTGELNIAALEASLSEIVRRHEILRSQIHIVDGRPVQVAVAVSRFEVPVIDLRSFTETEREGEVRHRIKAEAEWQFDFSAGLFFRAVLLQISNDQHILILTTHHIMADAWSMGILTRELWILYDAYANGRPSPLQDLAVQYADYAVWQREWLKGDVLESQLTYWKEYLKELPILNLPTDHPRPVKQSFHGARQPLSLPESLTTAVNELSRREGVTQFMTLLAAFQVLLYRYSGQEDVVVGLPVANRNRNEVQGLIGFIVNTLVLRTDLSEKPTFKELLQRVRNVCLKAYSHQDLPFEKLVQELHPERDLSRNPLFQVMFVLQNTPRPLPKISGLYIERIDVLPAKSPFDLSLYLRERDGKLIGFFEYNTDLFEPSTIERMIGHLEMLLEGIVADPGQAISTLPLLTEAERHRVLVEWNSTETEYPKDVCIHELFEAQVERTPESIAVQFDGKQLTYRELNRRANQLAHYLKGLGVVPEKLVGICIERSVEMVIGLLGILKAGGAYVPLDPAYPTERLAFMLSDSQCSFLVTQQKIIEDGRWKIEDGDSQFLRLGSGQASILGSQMKVVCLDTHWQIIAWESEQNIRSEVKPDNLAYVIYTSGSIGRPKGITMNHHSGQNLISWQLNSATTKAARTLQFTSLSFDVSFQEMFSTWCSGGTLFLISEEKRRDTVMWMRELQNHSIERLFLPVLVLQQFAELVDHEKANFTSLREIITAGEQLQITPQIRRLFKKLNCCRLHNQYGPTETHVVTSFTLEDSPGGWVSYPPIGRPIANTQIYVLDSCFQPVAIGVPGELYIGGAGVARGYLNRLELTAERFLPNPFLDEPEARMYRSGDLARYLPNGNVEFLGRVDSQVKIRGYRVELGEIEAVLSQHPAVKEGVVVVRERELSEETILVSYVVPRQHSATLASKLRSYLSDKLPEYMIPAVFVALDALPLLPNGKVDRQNLPSPEDTRWQVTQEFVAPRTEIEELVAQIWREVLKLENVGIYDNFFELGGHSLLATQIAFRLRDAFDREIPVCLLFDQPTVAELSGEIENLLRKAGAPELPPIVPVLRDGPLPLSLNQEHLWRMDQIMPGTHFFNMPYVYRLSGELNVEALKKVLKEIITRHEALRTVFGEVNGTPVQIIKSPSGFQLTLVDLRSMVREDLTQKATAKILEERVQPFDLTTGPLIRATLLRLTDWENLLLITLHHIISDHWSMRLFRGEFVALYEAFSQGCASPLSEPNIQFGDYACWEKCLLDSGLFKHQREYWRSQLAEPMTGSQLQTVHDATVSYQFKRLSIEVNQEMMAKIRLFANKESCTPFVVLVTVVVANLHLSTSQQNIRIGTILANRRRETEGTIGHFVNTVILCVQVVQETTLRDLLDQVRTAILAAYSKQEFPMELLMRELESEQEIDRDSLFRALINYQKHDSKPVNAAGLTFAPWNVPYTNSEVEPLPTALDLIVNLKETSTTLTGTVNVRIAAVNGVSVGEVANDLNGILEVMVSEPNRLVSKLNAIPAAEI